MHSSAAIDAVKTVLSNTGFRLARFAHDIAEVTLLSSRIGEDKTPQKAILAKEACFSQAREILVSTLIAGFRGEFRQVALVLSILSLMGGTEMAISRVVDNVVCKAVELTNAEPYTGLKNLYSSVTAVSITSIVNYGQAFFKDEKPMVGTISKSIAKHGGGRVLHQR